MYVPVAGTRTRVLVHMNVVLVLVVACLRRASTRAHESGFIIVIPRESAACFYYYYGARWYYYYYHARKGGTVPAYVTVYKYGTRAHGFILLLLRCGLFYYYCCYPQ
jgi:hypothetical protein